MKNELCVAASKGQWDIVNKLIEDGNRDFDIPLQGGKTAGLTPLWFASRSQAWRIVIKMINLGAKDFDVAPKTGKQRDISPFYMAVATGRWDIAEEMLHLGVKQLDAAAYEGKDKGKTALWFSAECNHIQMVLKLLTAGASLELEKKFTFSALRSMLLNLMDNLKNNNKSMETKENNVSISDTTARKINQLKHILNLLNAAKILFDIANYEANEQVSVILGILNRAINAKINGKTALECAKEKHNSWVINCIREKEFRRQQRKERMESQKNKGVQYYRLRKHKVDKLLNIVTLDPRSDSDSPPDIDKLLSECTSHGKVYYRGEEILSDSLSDSGDSLAPPCYRSLLLSRGLSIEEEESSYNDFQMDLSSEDESDQKEKSENLNEHNSAASSPQTVLFQYNSPQKEDSSSEESESQSEEAGVEDIKNRNNEIDFNQLKNENQSKQYFPKPREFNPVCCSFNRCVIL